MGYDDSYAISDAVHESLLDVLENLCPSPTIYDSNEDQTGVDGTERTVNVERLGNGLNFDPNFLNINHRESSFDSDPDLRELRKAINLPKWGNCGALTNKGTTCTRPTRHGDGPGPFYCFFHLWKTVGGGTKDSAKRCDGLTTRKKHCQKIVGYDRTTKPKFCAQHKHQYGMAKYVCCFGEKKDGIRCFQFVTWDPPYFPFCKVHAAQAKHMPSPFKNALPWDVQSLIVDLLAPEDRVALALTSKGCHQFVRSWAGNRECASYKTKAYLGPYISVFDMSYEMAVQIFRSGFIYNRLSNVDICAWGALTPHGTGIRLRKVVPTDKPHQIIDSKRIPKCTVTDRTGVRCCDISTRMKFRDMQDDPHTERFESAMKRYPWLFKTNQYYGRGLEKLCLICTESLIHQEYVDMIHPQTLRAALSICNMCLDHTGVYFPWCSTHQGEFLSPLHWARLYWSMQMKEAHVKRRDPGHELEERSWQRKLPKTPEPISADEN